MHLSFSHRPAILHLTSTLSPVPSPFPLSPSSCLPPPPAPPRFPPPLLPVLGLLCPSLGRLPAGPAVVRQAPGAAGQEQGERRGGWGSGRQVRECKTTTARQGTLSSGWLTADSPAGVRQAGTGHGLQGPRCDTEESRKTPCRGMDDGVPIREVQALLRGQVGGVLFLNSWAVYPAYLLPSPPFSPSAVPMECVSCKATPSLPLSFHRLFLIPSFTYLLMS